VALIEAWWGLLGFFVVLRKTNYERLQNTSGTISKLIDGITPALPVARRLHQMVSVASQMHLLPMTCLVQAITLRWMLNRRGIPSEVRIGAQKTPTGIQAHAWVEVLGHPIGKDILEKFSVLKSMEHTQR
jgi:hypothetical protein